MFGSAALTGGAEAAIRSEPESNPSPRTCLGGGAARASPRRLLRPSLSFRRQASVALRGTRRGGGHRRAPQYTARSQVLTLGRTAAPYSVAGTRKADGDQMLPSQKRATAISKRFGSSGLPERPPPARTCWAAFWPGSLISESTRSPQGSPEPYGWSEEGALGDRTIFNHMARIKTLLKANGVTGLLDPADKPQVRREGRSGLQLRGASGPPPGGDPGGAHLAPVLLGTGFREQEVMYST